MIGERVGAYVIERKLGEGGMGVVYLGTHLQLGRRVAIKVLHREFAVRPDIASRFFNEARAVNIVQHPGIVGAFDFGELPSGIPYIVMEYLVGESLGARLARRGPLGDGALSVARQIGAALAAAHEKGIIHRDLKPANVMLVPDPEAIGGERAKVLDFGIAKVAAEYLGPGGDHLRTRSGIVMGTPVYMSPEQCRDAASVTDRADVYSLGVILYQMLVGAPPFAPGAAAEVMAMHLYATPRPIREVDPAVPWPLSQLIGSMLAKEPSARPDMDGVVAALEASGAKSSQSLSALTSLSEYEADPEDGGRGSAQATTPAPASPSMSSDPIAFQSGRTGVPAPRSHRRRRLLLSIAGGLLGLAGVVLLGAKEARRNGGGPATIAPPAIHEGARQASPAPVAQPAADLAPPQDGGPSADTQLPAIRPASSAPHPDRRQPAKHRPPQEKEEDVEIAPLR